VTVSQVCERYGIPFMSADNSSPSLHRRGLKFYFRASPHDEMYSKAMFDFFDTMKKKGTKIETLSLFHEDTIFGTDSGNAQTKLAAERGYKIVSDIKYRANSPSLSVEVQQLKAANADVLMPSSYTTDGILLVKTMGELGYKPPAIVAQDAGFSEKALYDGEKIRDALAATDVPGEQTIMPWKRVKYDEMGQNNDADPVLLQYTGGKFVTIFPPQAAVAEATWPMK